MTSSEELLWVVIAKSCFCGLCMILAIIANASVLFVVYSNKKMRTVPNIFVGGLALADLLYALLGQSALIATTIPKKWILGDFMCKFIGVTNTTFLTASIWTLALISINRYVAIKKPFQLNQIFTKKRAFISTAFIWICSIAIAIPPVVGFGSLNAEYNYCLPDARSTLIYPALLITTNYIIPLICLVFCYISIYRAIKQQEKRNKEMGIEKLRSSQQDLTIGGYSPGMLRKYIENKFRKNLTSDIKYIGETDSTKSSTSNLTKISTVSNECFILSNPTSPNSFLEVPNFNYGSRDCGTITPNTAAAIEKHRLISKEKRLTLMLAVVVLAFFICFTPFVIACCLFAFKLTPSDFGLVTFGIVILGTNGVINPIIYGLMNKKFRKAYKSMYKCCFRSNKQQ